MSGKMTLLEIVQNIASAIDTDDVNSITDTVEAYQIARVVEETYFETLAALNIPSKDSLILLDSLADVTKPNYLKIPDTVREIMWFKYDYEGLGLEGDYQIVKYLDPYEFLSHCQQAIGNDPAQPYSMITDFSGAKIAVCTTLNPTYWTTFDNEYIVTDSYNSDLDSTLQSSKSVCWGHNNFTFLMEDDYVPDLDEDKFPLLLAESKSVCFLNLKQTASPKEEQRANRQRVRTNNKLWRANQRKPYNNVPDYGRRGRCGVINPLNFGPRT